MCPPKTNLRPLRTGLWLGPREIWEIRKCRLETDRKNWQRSAANLHLVLLEPPDAPANRRKRRDKFSDLEITECCRTGWLGL
jgi:hypothetical protein